MFCASSWLISEINILRCTVSKMSKYKIVSALLKIDSANAVNGNSR